MHRFWKSQNNFEKILPDLNIYYKTQDCDIGIR